MPRPVHTVKEGRVHLAVWENTREGGPPYDLTLCRRYMADDEWKTAYTFSAYDAEAIVAAVRKAQEFMGTDSASENTPAIPKAL